LLLSAACSGKEARSDTPAAGAAGQPAGGAANGGAANGGPTNGGPTNGGAANGGATNGDELSAGSTSGGSWPAEGSLTVNTRRQPLRWRAKIVASIDR